MTIFPRTLATLLGLCSLLATTACTSAALGPVSTTPLTYTPGPATITDTFERTIAGGWGEADLGGSYRPEGRECLAVRDGVARMQLVKPATSCQAGLTTVTPGDLAGSVEMTLVRLPKAGMGVYTGIFLRSNYDFYYQVGLRIGVAGKLVLSLTRFDGSRENPVPLGRELPLPFRAVAGRPFRVYFETTGDNPVKITASVSSDLGSDTSDPKALLSASDDSASKLIVGGGLEFWAYSSKSTPGPQTITYDNLQVGRLLSP